MEAFNWASPMKPRTGHNRAWLTTGQLAAQARPGQTWPGLASTGRGRQPGDKPAAGQPGMPRCLVAPLLGNKLDLLELDPQVR